MIWLTLLAMALLVFTSRYLFLEPRLPLRLNAQAQKLLSYSSPAVLTAIWAPIVFLPEGELSVSWHNPYLVAAVVAVLLAWKLKSVLLTAVISMAVFFLLSFL
ncbi:branched-chain amino acid ABC transporter [Photobacterium proteolyticum]|uniref:Branched-chain amino acid ABC transporter n=1 Tax=Photobacterium proteolyticum TaxID=1903952 RepID=A0A1Q9GCT7_9GAMM|nr:AzlD domain-containing protein [Photobacterium proteolyticum]OLQ72176.1 branched-chain amino acid ABC transporter [Photobacterium proteolyticum]